MRNLFEYLEKTCKTKGESPAIEAKDGSLSFAQLRRKFVKISGVAEEILVDYDSIDTPSQEICETLATETLSQARDVDPAYLLFTSGSTGVPKGVVIPHRRVINYIEWARECFRIESGQAAFIRR